MTMVLVVVSRLLLSVRLSLLFLLVLLVFSSFFVVFVLSGFVYNLFFCLFFFVYFIRFCLFYSVLFVFICLYLFYLFLFVFALTSIRFTVWIRRGKRRIQEREQRERMKIMDSSLPPSARSSNSMRLLPNLEFQMLRC